MTAGVTHGGSDSGPAPRWDFSSNANPLGPGPTVHAALSGVDCTAYPDPAYAAVRERIAAAEGVDPDRVVVGSGAGELLHRLAGAHPGPVAVLRASFGEYAHAATVHGRPLRTVARWEELPGAAEGAGLVIVGAPNNPDGAVPDRALLDRVADRAPLVVDLAYAELCQHPISLPAPAWRLVSPTKAHGVPGVRAGYLLAPPETARRLRERAPSWVLSAHGVALLAVAVTAPARAEVREAAATLWSWRDRLAAALAAAGWPVRTGAATFLLAEVAAAGGGTAVAAALRRRGLRVRDATSFGLGTEVRLAAQPTAAVAELVRALAELRRDRTRAR